MPSLPTRINHIVGSESWPPAAGRHPPSLDDDNSTDDEELDVPLLQRDPLTYFLSPPTPTDEDEFEFDFDFDAGIEDSNNPREIVRSISPSTLDGLKKYKSKGHGTDCAILDDMDDDEEEEYVRLGASKTSPLGLPDLGIDRPRPAGTTQSKITTEALLSPASFHVGSPRRPFQGRSRSLSLQRRHSWREPSPDVWSIEEEPAKETMSEMGLSHHLDEEKKTQPIDVLAAKPKKKVRFILPVKE